MSVKSRDSRALRKEVYLLFAKYDSDIVQPSPGSSAVNGWNRQLVLSSKEQRPMEISVVRDTISREVLTEIAKRQFGDMVKAVVDVEQGIMAIGGELHSDEEATLLDQGSVQRHLWGINLYPDKPLNEWIEFDSMINVRPSGGNRSRYVESAEMRDAVTRIVNRLVGG